MATEATVSSIDALSGEQAGPDPSILNVPENLPEPQDDGASKHLIGHPLPVLVELPCTKLFLAHASTPAAKEREAEYNERGYVDLFNVALSRPVLLFIYPRTAKRGEVIPESWNATPGARGCTPHLLSIPPLLAKMREVEPDLEVFGLSSQSPEDQQAAADSLQLPFRLLSDAQGELREKLELPSFEWAGQRWLKRTTLYLRESQCVNLNYPIFPSDTAAARALEMLKAYQNPGAASS